MRIKTWCILEWYINNCNDCQRLWEDDCESKKLIDLYKDEEFNLLSKPDETIHKST